MKRETWEETGLRITDAKLLYKEEIERNSCGHGADVHYWNLFRCNADGTVKRNMRETKSIGWYTPEEIKKLTLEPVLEYWFKKLKVI
mgnify:FL=1